MCLSELQQQQWIRTLDLHGFLPPVFVFHDVYGPSKSASSAADQPPAALRHQDTDGGGD